MLTDLNTDERKRRPAIELLKNHDESRDEALKQYTHLACQLLKVPMCFISILDDEKQYIKSAQNIDITETSLSEAFCVNTIDQGNTMICRDTLQHPVFKSYQAVNQAPFIRFYAGCPLNTRDGVAIGTLCILDTNPRTLSAGQIDIFEKLAGLVSVFLESWHTIGYIDIVTLLPNRQRLLKDIAGLRESTFKLVIIDCIDMPFAYEIARTLGMTVVESLLEDMVAQLQSIPQLARQLYSVAVGRFAFLVSAHQSSILDDLTVSLQGIQARMSPDVLLDLDIHLGDSGLCSQELTPIEILRRAVSALHEAISQGHRYMTYDEALDDKTKKDFTLLTDLRTALKNDQGLYLVYQPKVSLRTGLATGAEALLRWSHPERGEVQPGFFIPLVERTNLMRELTEWVIDHAIDQLVLWKDKSLYLPVSINLAASDFSRPGFADRLKQKMWNAGLTPAMLEIECLETERMLESPAALNGLNMLKKCGFKISLDDFGSGYSNINYLRQIPMDIIKIDRSIVGKIATDKGSRIVVQNIISLLKQLNYVVLAEGVEDEKTVAILLSQGCDEVQGFIYSKPLESQAFEAWYRNRNEGPLEWP